jgi:hypothetical protein
MQNNVAAYNSEMLLDDIIDLATDDKRKLSVVLRKCLVLAQKLKNERLKIWANQELNGYDSITSLPDYRIFNAPAFGDYIGIAGSSLKNYPLPAYLLKENHRDYATRVFLAQAIGALEDVVCNGNDRNLHFQWPADLITLYQEEFEMENGMVLASAKQVLSTSAVAGLLDNIRNRTLNMALELQSELGTEDLTKITAAEIEKVERTITTNIYGGTNIIASGHSQVNTSITQNAINVGDRSQLHEALRKTGLTDNDLNDLTEAEKADGDRKMGTRVLEWIKKNGSKAAIGGVKLGAEVTKTVLTAYIKQYMGLS